MSDCERNRELISLMLDGELTAEQEAGLRTHIASCDECRRVYEAFQVLSEAVSEDLSEPPEMLAKGVMFKIRNQKKHRKFVYGKFTAIAACLAVLLFSAAKFGFLGGGNTYLNMNAASEESSLSDGAYGAQTSGGTAGAGLKSADRQVSREDLKKGVKLEKSENGTVYQLGFPIQNFEVLSGAKPEEVQKEPVCLLDAKQLTVYKGEWHSESEAAKTAVGSMNTTNTADTAKTKNTHLADVSDGETLADLAAILTSVPDDSSGLAVDSKAFSEGEPVYTLYIPAQKQSDTADGTTSADTKTATFKSSLDNLKNNFLRKSEDDKKTDDTKKDTDDAKASPSPSASPDTQSGGTDTDEKQAASRDMTIHIWYVNGEIWCVAEPAETVKQEETVPESPAPSVKADKSDTDKSKSESVAPDASPSAANKTDKTVASSAPESEKPVCKLFCRILYKAAGTPEKLDALMKKLTSAGDVLLTQGNTKK